MAHYLDLIKGQDEDTYKKYAKEGMDLMFPVSVNGKTHRPDINVRYHNTIKLFEPSKDDPNVVHSKANQLDLTPPNPKEVRIEPAIIEGRGGYKMHTLKLYGPHADKVKAHNDHFKEHGMQQSYVFHPHITVDKETWDRVRSSGAKTAHEAGIEFHPAELRHGTNVLARYHDKKLAASENIENDLNKGAIKQAAAALGAVAAMALPSHAEAKTPYSTKRMLATISSVESQKGKYTQHEALSGIHHGEKAYGKYGITPNIIRETIHMTPELKAKHNKAMNLRGDDLHRYMQDNPGLEDTIAQRHLKRLEHHFGQNPEKIGYAWLQGIKGAYSAAKKKTNISDHWHVLKIKNAYEKEK